VTGERGGPPVSVVLSAANANDATMLEAVLDDIPPIVMPPGGAGPARSKLTGPTIIAAAVPTSDGEASARESPDAASSPRRGGPLPLDDRMHPRLAGRVAAAALLRAGAAGLLGHLLPCAATATVMTTTAVWSMPLPAR
jgi:hypothetical protein